MEMEHIIMRMRYMRKANIQKVKELELTYYIEQKQIIRKMKLQNKKRQIIQGNFSVFDKFFTQFYVFHQNINY